MKSGIKQRNLSSYLLVFLAIHAVWFFVLLIIYFLTAPVQIVDRLERRLSVNKSQLTSTKIMLAAMPWRLFQGVANDLVKSNTISGFVVYQNNTLVGWSDNVVAFPVVSDLKDFGAPVYVSGPNTLLIDTINHNPYITVIYKTVYSHFDVDNGFLKGGFSWDFLGSHNLTISDKGDAFPVSLSHQIVFKVELNAPHEFWCVNQWLTLAWLLFVFVGLVVIGLKYLKVHSHEDGFKERALQSLVVILSWFFVGLIFRLALTEVKGDLFRPDVFASGIFNPNVAALTINIIFLLVLATVWYGFDFEFTKRGWLKFEPFLKSVLMVIGFRFLIGGFRMLIIHSSVPLDTYLLSSLSIYSLIIYFLLFAIFFVWWLFSFSLIGSFIQFSIRQRMVQFIFFLCVTLICGGLCHDSWPFLLWEFMLASVVFGVIVFRRDEVSGIFFTSLPLSLVVMSAVAALLSFYISFYSNEKELIVRQTLAENYLLNGQDQIAESYLLEMQKDLSSDSIVLSGVSQFAEGRIDQNDLSNILIKRYFGGYLRKFSTQFTFCFPSDYLSIADHQQSVSCDLFFKEKSDRAVVAIDSSCLWFLGFTPQQKGYLSLFTFGVEGIPLRVYAELVPLSVSRGIGMTEITMPSSVSISRILRNYSYARYIGSNLMSHTGQFSYWRYLPVQPGWPKRDTLFNSQNWSHLLLTAPDHTILAVSLPQRSWFVDVTLFSYVFLGFSLFLLLGILGVSVYRRKNLYAKSFRNKFQGTVFLLILFTLFAIGASSVYFIVRLNESKNMNLLSDKAHSILIELQHKLSDDESLNSGDSLYLEALIEKFSDVFFTDINLYNASGFLLATSQPATFSSGLMAPYMNGIARKAMIDDGSSKFVHKEHVGELEFLSAYLPFSNSKGDILAYLNLPAFSRQDELKTEIGSFLVTFINVYAVILLVAALVGLLVARLITRPLQLVASHLSTVKLGSPNAKIAWDGTDELALLIVEYNRMLDELDAGTIELKIKEREATWREMARQVAHEIRNPLTPISLNVQYLQKAWQESRDDFGARFDRFVLVMTEQIDLLNSIANDFGQFGSLPKPKSEKVDILSIIEKVASLYSYSKAVIVLTTNNVDSLVESDAGLLQVVINNLIKNAVQSLPEQKAGKIEVSLHAIDQNTLEIQIADTGIGIPAADFNKIFTPYFTTKSMGTGIGLHLVYQIINSLKGKIWFQSEVQKGTTFYVQLPRNDVYSIVNY